VCYSVRMTVNDERYLLLRIRPKPGEGIIAPVEELIGLLNAVQLRTITVEAADVTDLVAARNSLGFEGFKVAKDRLTST
jgi:hypothetical protein